MGVVVFSGGGHRGRANGLYASLRRLPAYISSTNACLSQRPTTVALRFALSGAIARGSSHIRIEHRRGVGIWMVQDTSTQHEPDQRQQHMIGNRG